MYYVKTSFIFDMFVLFPFICEVFFVYSSFKFWNLLVFFKLPTYNEIMNNTIKIIEDLGFSTTVFELTRLLLFVIFVAHLFGIAW